MRDPERLTEVVREWVEKAENDLVAAVHTLTLRERCPSDMVCFHAQQCVEKYLKAIWFSPPSIFPKRTTWNASLLSCPVAWKCLCRRNNKAV